MTLNNKILTIATASFVTSSAGAFAGYSTSSTKALEKKSDKFEDPFVWSSFKGKGVSSPKDDKFNPVDWF